MLTWLWSFLYLVEYADSPFSKCLANVSSAYRNPRMRVLRFLPRFAFLPKITLFSLASSRQVALTMSHSFAVNFVLGQTGDCCYSDIWCNLKKLYLILTNLSNLSNLSSLSKTDLDNLSNLTDLSKTNLSNLSNLSKTCANSYLI